ncbi:MAG: hypothetical protein JNJ61_10755 [Anaerolineae bacterium]|nr:hypothetical protein [Anaerolineae bacterium]
MVSTASSFKRSSELVLSSGQTVMVRKVNMARIVLSAPKGTLPDAITAQVVRGLTKGQNGTPEQAALQFNEDELPELASFMDMIVRAAVVLPRIVESNPGDDEITLNDLTQDEHLEIFSWATGGAGEELKAAESFRDEQPA